jgi:hypothetical protein
MARVKQVAISLQLLVCRGKAFRQSVCGSLRRNIQIHLICCGPGSSVGIAIGCGLDGPGIESRCGRDFPHLSRPDLGPTQPPGISRG